MQRRPWPILSLFLGAFALCWHALLMGATGTGLQNGVPFPLNVPAKTYFNDIYIDVPDAASKLTLALSGGSGNLDLHAKFGAAISGSTFTAVQNDADVSSSGPLADESIVLTATSNPALQAGRWYIAPVNRNNSATSATLTATMEGVIKYQINLTTGPPGVYTPGNTFNWKFEIIATAPNGEVDIYAAVTTPDGGLLFLAGEQGFSNQIVPFQVGVRLVENEASSFLYDYPTPGWLVEGDYAFYAGLVQSGEFPLTEASWLSNLSTSSAYISRLSPPQRVFIDNRGYPEQFIKTFAKDNGHVRVDETWFYVQQQKGVSFVDGVLVKEYTLEAGSHQTGALGFHPEDYTWDSTVDEITARHGQPVQTLNSAPGNEPFYSVFPADTYHVYSDIVFGFNNNALVSAVAVR